MFFLSGLSQIKNSVSYVWASECTSIEYKPRAYTMINVVDAFPMVFTCFYFMFISKNWIYLSIFFNVLTYVGNAAAFICPESPRWLLINSRSKEAIKVLNDIAKMNKVDYVIPSNAIFVEDPANIGVAAIESSEKNSRIASSHD